MNKMKAIILLLNRLGYKIEYRDYISPSNEEKIYITNIGGVKYRTPDQPKARIHIDKILEELDETEQDS